MSETFQGTVEVRNDAGDTTVSINGNAAALEIGGNNNRGDFIIRDENNNAVVEVREDGGATELAIRDETNQKTFEFSSSTSLLELGGQNSGSGAHIRLYDREGKTGLGYTETNGLALGREDKPSKISLIGDLVIRDDQNAPLLTTSGSLREVKVDKADLVVKDGRLVVKDAQNQKAFDFNGQNGVLWLRDSDNRDVLRINTRSASMRIGHSRKAGEGPIRDRSRIAGEGPVRNEPNETTSAFDFSGQDGELRLMDKQARDTLIVDANSAHMQLGGTGNGGELKIKDDQNRTVFYYKAEKAALVIGEQGNPGHIKVQNSGSKETIHLNGETGDIILANADCAEEFDLLEEMDPGTVMVIDAVGKLKECTDAYDKKVAGVISGAGQYKPGIVLDRQATRNTEGIRMPLALMGKVYCKVTAEETPIEVGDLLTTSSLPGHAMKAGDPLQAFGTVIGKALSPMPSGTGLIPILIALQ
ncbi:hypothetical protein S7335_3018 [Synechococcus sp. PCC 7335]|uniref:hypothetical protein n=1 Tax=Synechococcus sp. (strain ATCC 29403 / PCC 7335) TaxID=91464 RepID=UPI00017EE7F7|nr:hypothetical protein [Synechococcus sp. PCC 7335]EDX85319.1 hypothetical protein S7335_3018 [Synechococcus sp. PCC 7335]